jgi:2-keto-myo-inositol isomerase
MPARISRRQLLAAASAGTAATGLLPAVVAQGQEKRLANGTPTFRFCLNSSTIRGQNLSPPQQVEIAARAGYHAIEPWIGELHKHVEQGGSLADLKKQISDHGLTVESAIGFAEWIVDDDTRRAQAVEAAKRDMDAVRQIGGTRMAAPPAGGTKQTLNLSRVAERYRALLEAGSQIGVVPQLELWGFSQTLSRLGELLFVAAESNHPDACLLPDVFHLHKGGSDFGSLRLVNGQAIHVFHMNDFPAKPERAAITDADRVYPGDGVAPLAQLFQDLKESGFRGFLSLELFSRELWKQDALAVALTGIEKMRAAVEKAKV